MLHIAFALAVITTANAPLNSVLSTFSDTGDPARASRVVSAIATSPQLVEDLNTLAASGALKAIVLKPDNGGRFHAEEREGVITLTRSFVDEQYSAGGSEAVPAETGSRNVVFILGYMASKLKSASAMAASEEKIKATIRRSAHGSEGKSIDITAPLLAWQRLDLANEAVAYLNGWNDEIDAAMTAKGSLLTPPEVLRLMANSRNAHVLLQAAFLTDAERLAPSGTLQFPVNEHNIHAIVSVLAHTGVPDFH